MGLLLRLLGGRRVSSGALRQFLFTPVSLHNRWSVAGPCSSVLGMFPLRRTIVDQADRTNIFDAVAIGKLCRVVLAQPAAWPSAACCESCLRSNSSSPSRLGAQRKAVQLHTANFATHWAVQDRWRRLLEQQGPVRPTPQLATLPRRGMLCARFPHARRHE